MINAKTINSLKKQNDTNDLKVSIIIPVHPKSNGSNIQEDKTRFKNAIQSIANTIKDNNDEKRKIINKLEKLLSDNDFWLHQNLSLAVYASKDFMQTIKLNIETTSICNVSKKFILSPLIIAQNMQNSCLVLEMNLESPRVLMANTETASTLKDAEFISLKEMMEGDYQRQQQFHSPQGSNGKGSPMFHGHGGVDDHKIDEVNIYLHYVAGIVNAVSKKHELPLLMIGDKKRLTQLAPMLKQSKILDQKIYGNYQNLNESELHEKIKDVLDNIMEQSIDQSLSELEGSNTKVSGLQKIQNSLTKKAISMLYLPVLRMTSDSVRSGNDKSFVLNNETANKFEDVILQTIEQGGTVQPVPESSLGKSTLSALLRFKPTG